MLKSQDELFLNSFSPRELYDHDRLEALKAAAYNLIDSYDLPGAYQFVRKLEKIMKELSPQSESEKDNWVIAYFWLVRLKVATFQVSTLPEQLEIFQKFLIFALKNKFDIQQEVTKYLELFSTPKMISEILTSFLHAVTKSPLTFGKLTIENWIIQYHSSLAARRIKGIRPGTFDIVNFLNNNNYARALTPEEKNLLKSLLALYNWMGDYASKMQNAAVSLQARRPAAPVYMKRERMTLPAPPPAKFTMTPLTSPLMRGERGGSGVLPPPPRPALPRKPTVVPETRSGESNKVEAKQDLYRSVLKELARKHAQPQHTRDFSINESVASGSATKNYGEIVAGQEEVEKKLKDLESRVE